MASRSGFLVKTVADSRANTSTCIATPRMEMMERRRWFFWTCGGGVMGSPGGANTEEYEMLVLEDSEGEWLWSMYPAWRQETKNWKLKTSHSCYLNCKFYKRVATFRIANFVALLGILAQPPVRSMQFIDKMISGTLGTKENATVSPSEAAASPVPPKVRGVSLTESVKRLIRSISTLSMKFHQKARKVLLNWKT